MECNISINGQGAALQIGNTNIGSDAGGHNSNHGTGAGGINSGYASGAINGGNASGAINSIYNPEMEQRQRFSDGASSLGGGSSRSVQRVNGFGQRNKYFFCKFPNNWGKKRLRGIFSKYGTISSIRIPRRRDKFGNRFGFVTFTVVDKEGLEKLDKTPSYKIRVNPNRSSSRARNKVKTEENMKVGDANATESFEDDQNRMVIKETVEGDDEIIEFKTDEKEKAWLNCCLVGCAREPKDIGMVRENLYKQGLTAIIPVEGNLVLLRFSNRDNPSTLLDKGRDFLEQHFHWVEHWSANIVKERYTYIRCVGVPLEAWGERFFRKIGEKCGRFVSVDDSTMKKLRLDFGRVLISTYSEESISKCLTFMVDSQECKIRVIEEAFQSSDWDMSDNDCTVGDGRSDVVEPQSDGDGSLCNGDNMDMQNEEIFTGNIECSNVQNAPQECSLGPKLHSDRQEGDEVVGSNDNKGLQEEQLCVGDEGIYKGDDDMDMQEEEIFIRTRRPDPWKVDTECNVQTAPQKCSLGSKQDMYSCGEGDEGDEEISSSDEGFQEMVGSESHINQPHHELGSRNMNPKPKPLDSGQSDNGPLGLVRLDKSKAHHLTWTKVLMHLMYMLSVVWTLCAPLGPLKMGIQKGTSLRGIVK